MTDMWVGAADPSAFWVRGSTDAASVRLAVADNPDLTDPAFFGPASPTAQGIVSIEASALDAGRQWWCAWEEDDVVNTDILGRVRTHPLLGEPAHFEVAAAACAGASPTHPGSDFGQAGNPRTSNHPVFDVMRERDPLFFAHLGDLHYRDIDTADSDRYRDAYTAVLHPTDTDRQSRFLRQVAQAYVFDDHDYGPDNSDRTHVGRDNALTVYRERVPHYTLPAGTGANPIYQSFQVGRVLFVAADVRSDRDPNDDPQSASKTMLGAAQKTWMDSLLASSDAELLVWLMPDVWTRSTSDSWSQFQHERDELVAMLGDHGWLGRMLMLSGDMHALAIESGDNNQWGSFPIYQLASIDSNPASLDSSTFDTGPNSPGRWRYGLVDIDDAGHVIRVTGRAMIRNWRWRQHTFEVATSTPKVATSSEIQTVSASADVGGMSPVELASWSVERELATDLPEQVRETTGVSAASARLEIVAPEGSELGHWSPWLRKQRRTRQPVTIDVSVDGETQRVLTGHSVDAGADADGPTLSMSALDEIARMGEPLPLPAFGAQMGIADGRPYNPGLHALWVIEHALRPHELSPLGAWGPAPLVVVSAAGSLYPNEGVLFEAFEEFVGGEKLGTPTFDARPDLPLISTVRGAAAYSLLPSDDVDELTLGAIVGVAPNPGSDDNRARLTVTWINPADAIDQYLVRVFWISDTDGFTVRIELDADGAVDSVDWVDLADHGRSWVTLRRVDTNTPGTRREIEAQLIQDGTVLATETLGLMPAGFDEAQSWFVATLMEGAPALGLQALEGVVSTDDLPSWSQDQDGERGTFTLDLPSLEVVPPLEGVSSVDVLRGLADAQQGAFLLDAQGEPVVRSRAELRGVVADPIRMTSWESLAGFRWAEEAEQVAGLIQVDYTHLDATAHDPMPDVWEATERLRVNPGTVTLSIEVDEPVAALDRWLTRTGSGSRYRANRRSDGQGESVDIGFPVADLVSPTRATLIIHNPHTFPVWMVDTAGDPLLVVAARATVTEGRTVGVSRDTGADASTVSLEHNPWRQSLVQARALADFLHGELATPRPMLRNVRVVPNLDITAGSTIELEDPHISGLSVRALVRKVRLSGSPGELVQTLEVQPLRPTFADVNDLWDALTFADVNDLLETFATYNLDPLSFEPESA